VFNKLLVQELSAAGGEFVENSVQPAHSSLPDAVIRSFVAFLTEKLVHIQGCRCVLQEFLVCLGASYVRLVCCRTV
jgi:hypothetical protein